MKKIGKIGIVAWVLAVLPIIIVCLTYKSLPEQVPMHWDFNGEVGYSDKWQLFVLALMSPVMELMFVLLPKIDPKKKNYGKFKAGYEVFQAAMMLFILVLISVCIIEGMRPGTVNVAMVVCVLCSALFIILGNMLPTFRPNFFCGIKNPWTISSEKVWARTHRMAGRMMFASGIIGLIGAFAPNGVVKIVSLFVPTMLACIIPTVFSYIWFRNEQKG